MRAITYENINEKIVDLLEFKEDDISLYAARRIEQLEAIVERQRAEMVIVKAQVEQTEGALAHCGIGGIYDVFDSPADAIDQMAGYIGALEKRLGINVEVEIMTAEFVQIGLRGINPAHIVNIDFGDSHTGDDQVWIDLVDSGQEDTDSCWVLEGPSARAFKEWWGKQKNVCYVNPAWYEETE